MEAGPTTLTEADSLLSTPADMPLLTHLHILPVREPRFCSVAAVDTPLRVGQTRFVDVRQQVALERAVDGGDVAHAAALLEAGADATASCHGLDTPILDIALAHGDKAMARLLVDHGARLDEKESDGRTPLHRAASAGDDSATLTLLLELGSDPNAKDSQGWTPLHFGAAYGYASNVAALLAAGASPALRTRHDLLPHDLATRNRHAAVAEELSRALVAGRSDDVDASGWQPEEAITALEP
jgi:ankyrin repeat protein